MSRKLGPFAITCLLLSLTVSCFEMNSHEEYIANVFEFNIPDSVKAGHMATIILVSSGSNGCWEKGRDEIRRRSDGFLIIPYDKFPNGDPVCTSAFVQLTHMIPLLFQKAGRCEVTVRYSNSLRSEDYSEYTKEVVVY